MNIVVRFSIYFQMAVRIEERLIQLEFYRSFLPIIELREGRKLSLRSGRRTEDDGEDQKGAGVRILTY